MRWKGNDYRTGIVNRLQGDGLIGQAMMRSRDITIRAGDGEWKIQHMDVLFPSKEEWNCYQAIARHLLAIEVVKPFCFYCRAQIGEGATYCGKCGARGTYFTF